jgi:hypothetical protein
MKFLSKLGAIILKMTEIVAGFAPLAAYTMPSQAANIQVVSTDLAAIASIITNVEAVGQALTLAGPQKLQAAAPLVAQVLLQSSLLANHKIAQPELFKAGSQKMADGMADVLNSLADNIITVTKT